MCMKMCWWGWPSEGISKAGFGGARSGPVGLTPSWKSSQVCCTAARGVHDEVQHMRTSPECAEGPHSSCHTGARTVWSSLGTAKVQAPLFLCHTHSLQWCVCVVEKPHGQERGLRVTLTPCDWGSCT